MKDLDGGQDAAVAHADIDLDAIAVLCGLAKKPDAARNGCKGSTLKPPPPLTCRVVPNGVVAETPPLKEPQ